MSPNSALSIMQYSINSSLLHLLSSALLLRLCIAIDPLYHICSKSSYFTSGCPYDKNLNMLFNQLAVKSPPTGFGMSSVGNNPDTVHGLALCRGDVSNADCKSCLSAATKEILQSCPNDKGAIIWYDNCLLKYSNINFLGTIDSRNKVYLINVQNVSDIESFNEKTRELLYQLTDKALVTQRLFATDEASIGGSQKLYGLVQCTNDLSRSLCKTCLNDAINELTRCCDQKRGGRVIGGSCNFRYELYPFVSS